MKKIRHPLEVIYPLEGDIFCEAEDVEVMELPDCGQAEFYGHPSAPELVFCRRYRRHCYDCGQPAEQD